MTTLPGPYSQRATSCPTYLHDYLAWPLLTTCNLISDLLAIFTQAMMNAHAPA